MSVYFKFKSTKDFHSLPIEGQFISIGNLKDRIFKSKHFGRGNDFDLVVSNAQTNEEYTDEAALITRNTSVLIRRVPGHPRMSVVANIEEVKAVEDSTQNITLDTSNAATQLSTVNPEESEWDDFGDDPYAIIPEGQQPQSFNPANVSSADELDEDSKLRAVLETSSLDWSSQNDGPRGRGCGRGIGGRMGGGRGFGRGLFEHQNPLPGYVCHRCNVPGHFIQNCPTNGNPAFNLKRFKPPTGIPKSMLMTTPDGSYSLPGGAVAVLQPNEASFFKAIEGIPTIARAAAVSAELLPENLRCPLCKEIMKAAVLTSKCCFSSFCDKCIREHILNQSKCACGATKVLPDDLLPNKTLRETIDQLLESAAASSQEKTDSLVEAQDMQSCVTEEKVPLPAVSGLMVEAKGLPAEECSLVGAVKALVVSDVMPESGTAKDPRSLEGAVKALVVSDVTPESGTAKDPRSLEKSPLKEDLAEKLPIGDQAKMKKKKQRLPTEEVCSINGFMPMAGPGFNPYFSGLMPHMPMDPFMCAASFTRPMHPFLGLPPAPFEGGSVPDPYMVQPYMNMMPPASRDIAELALGNMGMNMGPHPMMHIKENLEGRRVDFRRKRDIERPSENFDWEREHSREWDARRRRREGSSATDISVNKHIPSTSQAAYRSERSERSKRLVSTREREHRARSPAASHCHSPRPTKRRLSQRETDEAATEDPLAAADLPQSKKLKEKKRKKGGVRNLEVL
ncbi:hypothetical protein LUZ62_084759 [Rhynchospora pubera]|uniref:DWNN domain-containing protein n=1 Tax=Rhynchospora pubera TaxID=906938 RepID=A0AAV8C6H2_9POAL|nr:hypothetical protein LUZ62_084759 [Rhynchospora pubera]